MDSLVPHPGAAQTRSSEYVLLGRGSVRTAAPRNLSSCMRSHPSRGPVLAGIGAGPLVANSNRSGGRFIPGHPMERSRTVVANLRVGGDTTWSGGWPSGGRRAEPGIPFLQEGGHALELVLGPEQVQEQLALSTEAVRVAVGGDPDRTFGGGERLARTPREAPRVLEGGVEHLVGWAHDLGDAEIVRPPRIRLVAGVDEPSGRARPDQPREALRPAG